MRTPSWLRHSVQIARIEWTRNRRQAARSSTWQSVLTIGLGILTIASGIGAYIVGKLLVRGDLSVPFDLIQAVIIVGFVMYLWMAVQRTSRVIKRIDTTHLLTTVPASEVAFGAVLLVYMQVSRYVVLAVLGGAVGFALGMQSLIHVVTIPVAMIGLGMLAVLLGMSINLGMTLATSQYPRIRRYQKPISFVVLFLGALGWSILRQQTEAVALLTDWLRYVPITWFVDLALLGVPGIDVSVVRSIGALCLLIVGISVLIWSTVVLMVRVWDSEPVSAATIHRSRTLVGRGIAERVFAGWVSRPVLTVARKRWLQERRIPLRILMIGYLLFFVPVMFFPVFLTGVVPGLSLVIFAFLCAAWPGIAFGLPMFSTEYPSLPMTLTTIPGSQFVRGTVLAGVALSAPITIVGILGLGIWSPLGLLEMGLLALAGVVLCVTAVTVGAVIATRISYYEYRLVPVPYINTPVYDEGGKSGFLHLGMVLAMVGLVCLPAFIGYGVAFLAMTTVEPLDTMTRVIRVGSLVLTLLLASGVSIWAYRRAITQFNEYTLP